MMFPSDDPRISASKYQGYSTNFKNNKRKNPLEDKVQDFAKPIHQAPKAKPAKVLRKHPMKTTSSAYNIPEDLLKSVQSESKKEDPLFQQSSETLSHQPPKTKPAKIVSKQPKQTTSSAYNIPDDLLKSVQSDSKKENALFQPSSETTSHLQPEVHSSFEVVEAKEKRSSPMPQSLLQPTYSGPTPPTEINKQKSEPTHYSFPQGLLQTTHLETDQFQKNSPTSNIIESAQLISSSGSISSESDQLISSSSSISSKSDQLISSSSSISSESDQLMSSSSSPSLSRTPSFNSKEQLRKGIEAIEANRGFRREFDWQAHEMEEFARLRNVTKNLGIVYTIEPRIMELPSVEEKAHALKQLMPKINIPNLRMMAAFIEINREKLIELAKRDPNGLYLRREVTLLPLSLLITPTGRVIWETKKKARNESPMGDSFKRLFKCVDHDKNKLLVSGTMKISKVSDVNNASAFREVSAGLALQGFRHIANIVHTMNYRAKLSRSLSHTETDQKIKIVMDYYANGDLKDVKAKEPGILKKKEEDIVQSLLEGVFDIHHAGWVHGDFKPGNIFFDDYYNAFIGDFGCTHKDSDFSEEGFIPFYHPDYFSLHQKNELQTHPQIRLIQQKQDMYALGVTLAFMLMQKPHLLCDEKTLFSIINSNLLQLQKFDAICNSLEKNIRVSEELPGDNAVEKLVKKLVNSNFNEIPTIDEAMAYWKKLHEPTSKSE